MRKNVCLLLVALLSVLAAAEKSSDCYGSFRVAGYYPDYFGGQLPVSQIRFDKLTDVIYFSIYPNPDGTLNQGEIYVPRQDQLVAAAHENGARVSICVGGWGLSGHFSAVAANPATRAALVRNLSDYCLTNNFDGVDLDWEPVSAAADKQNYTSLIRELKAALEPHGKTLSVAVFARGSEFLPEAIAAIDRLHVMAYDMYMPDHSTWEDSLAALAHWESYGFPRDKILLGMPFYGRDVNWGFYGYKEIVRTYQPAPEIDEVDGVCFNGLSTIRRKTRHTAENGYGGVMVWELTQDTTDHTSLLTAIADTALQALPPDFNGDRIVDLADLNLFLSRWFRVDCFGVNGWCSAADRNQSGAVDLDDLALFSRFYKRL